MSDHQQHGDAYEGPADPYDTLSRFDDEFSVPDDMRGGGGQRPGLDVLEDGSYIFDVVEGGYARTSKSNDDVFRLVLRVMNGPLAGIILEKAYFLSSLENAQRLGADLISLGVPADRWTKQAGVRFSQAIRDPGVAKALAGKRFSGKKTSKDGTNKKGEAVKYHNLYINALVGTSPMPSMPSGGFAGFAGFAGMAVTPPAPPAAPPAPRSNLLTGEADIPF
jgi:hypothetical protein